MGTESSYESFLKKHPHAKQANDATRLLEELRDDQDWRKAESSGKIAAYEQFLDIHPQSKKTDEAQRRLRELRYAEAGKRRTLPAFAAFLGRYSEGVDVDTLRAELPSIQLIEKAWQTARQSNSLDNYRAYLSKYPDGDHAIEAKVRIQIPEFNKAFGVAEDFTDAQIHACVESLADETYSTVIGQPLEYYVVTGGRRSTPEKSKVVIPPSAILKACSLQLEAGNLSVRAVYISAASHPPVGRALFPNKWRPTMTHNGFAGPGLEINLPSSRQAEFARFLYTYSIYNRERDSTSGGTLGYVLPDLVSGSDRQATPYPHYGSELSMGQKDEPLVFKVDGVKGMPVSRISTYDEAIVLKTYLKILSNK